MSVKVKLFNVVVTNLSLDNFVITDREIFPPPSVNDSHDCSNGREINQETSLTIKEKGKKEIKKRKKRKRKKKELY